MRNAHFRTPRLNQFPRMLLAEWRKLKLPIHDETVVVAVSGGADSTALLLALHELRSAHKLFVRLCVAHLDHKLRPSSSKDAKWVSELAEKLGYESVIGRSRRTRYNPRGTQMRRSASEQPWQ